MRASGLFWFLFLLLLILSVNLRRFGRESSRSNPVGMVSAAGSKKVLAHTVKTRKLKDNVDPHTSDQTGAPSHVSFEDYGAIDPVPTSKTSIRHGPIQHDTPVMPYIPGPSPPPE